MAVRTTGLIALLAAAVLLPAGLAGGAVSAGGDRVTQLPTLGPVAQPQFAGYASTQTEPCADLSCSDRPGLFYWLVGRDTTYGDDPTVLWSNGGPGASSFYGFLSESGPYVVHGQQLVSYEHSWTGIANYLFFDHPLGVGMSFPFHGQISQNLGQGIRQLANAVDHVVRRDGLDRSPLFLTGESYGGTYMPLLALELHLAHRDVHVGGVVIVDGWVAPMTQVGTSAQYAVTHGLIDAAQKRRRGTSTTGRSRPSSIEPTSEPRSTRAPTAPSPSDPIRSTRTTPASSCAATRASSGSSSTAGSPCSSSRA
jgi:cathepsin A (carboxypeptidase C)